MSKDMWFLVLIWFIFTEQLVDPYTYIYDTAVFSRNGEAPVYYNNTYQTDVIHTKGLEALRGQRNETKPFFLWCKYFIVMSCIITFNIPFYYL